ncbi:MULTISPECIES: 3-oxoacyl-ACP synthase [Roseivirga]|uniref:3-oxoacyl-ACP synthase n=2 Tax=Roseivirga TaxID=290180 RepID=A0ABQ3I579_9BACT|nr:MULTISPECIES: 3-oxoacyl-ACP synthase [Roseivirga]MEC7753218.1 3-oxoacyl-ACP synthase [Bacteroidota bacterium]GHE59408.1 hypothetical protein GCM10011340_12600 [Roseivirga thermotolerans]
MLELKRDVFRMCSEKVGARINTLEAELRSLSESAASDTKSSMGDKYETSREMVGLEQEKVSEQLDDARQMRKVLESLNVEHSASKIIQGSLVRTSTVLFYIAVSLGKITVGGKDVFVISPVSPIGKELMGKEVNHSIAFAGKMERIIAIA